MEKATAYTDFPDAARAGSALGDQLNAGLSGSPNAIIVFAAPTYDHVALLTALSAKCPDALMIGSPATRKTPC